MKWGTLIVGLFVLLGCSPPLAAHRPKNYSKETTVDLSAKRAIFLGWVALPLDQWRLWGYENQEDWKQVITDLNRDFQSSCKGQYLVGRAVTNAVDEKDGSADGSDLYIKFSDVYIDHDYYGIRLSIHFIDPKTNTEIAMIPSRLYYEKRWFKFELYMRAALDEVSRKIQVEVTGGLQDRKGK